MVESSKGADPALLLVTSSAEAEVSASTELEPVEVTASLRMVLSKPVPVVSSKLEAALRQAVSAARANPTDSDQGPALHAIWKFVDEIMLRAGMIRQAEASAYGGLFHSQPRSGCDTVRSACVQVVDVERAVEAWGADDKDAEARTRCLDNFPGLLDGKLWQEDEDEDEDFEPPQDDEGATAEKQKSDDESLEQEALDIDAEDLAAETAARPGEPDICTCCAARHAALNYSAEEEERYRCYRLHKFPGKYPPGSDERRWLDFYLMVDTAVPDEVVEQGCLPPIAFKQALAHSGAVFYGMPLTLPGITEAAADTLRLTTEAYIKLSAQPGQRVVPEPSIDTLIRANAQICIQLASNA